MKYWKALICSFAWISAECAIGGSSSETLAIHDKSTFEEFLQEFDITLSPSEFEERKKNFDHNMAKIQKHNLEMSSWKLGITPFMHLSDEEFQGILTLQHDKPATKSLRSQAPKPDISDLPKQRDWRDEGIISPVKNQGMCGSCWAFGATQTVESYWALKTNKLEILSPQQMVECTANPRRCGGSGGCSGATEQLGFQTIIDMGGMAKESDYPYVSGFGQWSLENCKKNNDGTLKVPITAKVKEIVTIEPNSYEHVLHHLATTGPLSIALDANTLPFYRGGVFDGCPTGNKNVDVNHAVQLVGYGENERDGKFWIIKNSWGNRWGEQGYMRLRRNEPGSASFCGWNSTPAHGSACADDDLSPVKVCGACGMLSETQYVIVDA